MALQRNLHGGKMVFVVELDHLLMMVSEHTMAEIARDEVQKQLTNDPELRILVREMVKEAISRMNLQEIVTAAVRDALPKIQENPDVTKAG